MPDSQATALDGIELLQHLAPAERAAVARHCRWRRYAADEQIIDYMSDSRDVCFIVEGRVRVVNFALSGREISFDDVGVGGFLGELSAFDGEPRSASVVALTNTQVAFLSPPPFLDLVVSNRQVALFVLRRLAGIIRSSTGRIMDLSTLGANNRVHAELLRLAQPLVKADNTAEISPIPVHADIASRVSTTRETVARVLSDLHRDRLVERRGAVLVIMDFERLKEMVEDVRG
ncbi:MAG: cyclic nucleotide-binding domain-containing protein [Azospirillum sp.]|nr:cyclic nucleotide-binding domain-containing protein [Azospirillum sp.]